MRDMDLFVGVASVGNDPAWADGGRRETESNAWSLHAFGDRYRSVDHQPDPAVIFHISSLQLKVVVLR